MSGLEKNEDGLENKKSGMDGVEQPSSGGQGKNGSSPSSERIKELSKKLVPVSEILETVLKDIASRGTTPTYPTGLNALDALLWGLHKKELLIMGARTSQGKSSLAFQLALHLASIGQKVAYFSLEMSKEQLVERMIAYHARINSRAIKHGLAQKQIENSASSLRAYSRNLTLLIDEGGFTFEEIVDICELVPFDFVFIDYIQMVSVKGYKSKLEAIDEYVRKFKELAKTMNFGGVIVSQVNREGVKDMGLHHLKGSGTLEEHPDTVLLLDWDWEKDTYTIRVDKQRHGECGDAEVRYEPEYFTFSDITGPARVLPGKGLSKRGDGATPPSSQYKD